MTDGESVTSFTLKLAVVSAVLFLLPELARADGPITNWLLDPATPLARDVRTNLIITLAVMAPFLILAEGLLLYAVLKFKSKNGRKPATFHENFKLEVIWTILPAVALVVIAVPAFGTLKKIDVPPKSDLVVEVIGHQFFWEYRYPKYGVTIAEKPLIVPVDKVVTLNLTSVDVIHSWFVPAFGVKQDATPGRISHSWFNVEQEGNYKGQCAELCGELHAKMYIDVEAVSSEKFEGWLSQQVAQGATPATTTQK